MKKTVFMAAMMLLMIGIFTSCEKEKEVVGDVVEKTDTTEKTENTENTEEEKASSLPERIFELTYGKSFSEATRALLQEGYTLSSVISAPARMPQPEIYQSFIKEFPNRVEDVTLRVNDEQKVDACVMGIDYTTLPEHSEFNAEALSWCEFVKTRFVKPTRIDLRLTIDKKWYEYADDKYIDSQKEELKAQFEAGKITETEYLKQLENINKIPVYPQFYTDILTDFEEYKKIQCLYGKDGSNDVVFRTYGVYDSTNETAFIVCDMIELLSGF